MKNILLIIAAIGISTNAHAVIPGVENGGATCWVVSAECFRTSPDSTCNDICSSCSGQATVPTGYAYINGAGNIVSNFFRTIVTDCDGGNSSTYSCLCKTPNKDGLLGGELKCATGYYGYAHYIHTSWGGDQFSGCYRCPSSGGIYGTTAGPGATSVTECYIPSGNSFSDSTGSGEYTGNCYY